MSTQAKLDMASTMKTLPRSWQSAPTDSTSFMRPEVVSEWTIITCVMAGSASSAAATFSTCGIWS